MSDRIYFNEYPLVEFPQVLRDLGFEDNSWHNDASARARKEVDADKAVIVWCAEDTPDQREIEGAKRYTVVTEVDGDIFEEVGETDEVTDLPALVAKAIKAVCETH